MGFTEFSNTIKYQANTACQLLNAVCVPEDESVANANPITDTTSFGRALEPPVSQDLEPQSILIVFL